jgi:hypothetical protein
MFDDNPEDTVFEPNPYGARQRVVPNIRFKAVASAIRELDPSQIIDEDLIVTTRVPRLPPPPPRIVRTNVRLTARHMLPPPPPAVMPELPASRLAHALSRFALPIGGVLVVVLLSLYLALPGHTRNSSAAIAPLAIGCETPTETFQLTTSDDEPPATHDELSEPAPQRLHRANKSPRHRKVVAVDSSTPLGNLRPH